MRCQHVYHGASPRDYEEGNGSRVCRECGWRERSIVLPYIPPGSNQLFQMHYQTVGRHRLQVRNDVTLLLTDEPRQPLDGYARVTLDFRWRTKQRRDAQNYVEGTKGAVDALVGRWLVDDDTAHCEVLARGQVGTGEPDHVVITVEEA